MKRNVDSHKRMMEKWTENDRILLHFCQGKLFWQNVSTRNMQGVTESHKCLRAEGQNKYCCYGQVPRAGESLYFHLPCPIYGQGLRKLRLLQMPSLSFQPFKEILTLHKILFIHTVPGPISRHFKFNGCQITLEPFSWISPRGVTQEPVTPAIAPCSLLP